TGFLGILKNGAEILRRVPIACIGPVTERTVRREGLTPSVVSGIHTTAGLADAMSDFFDEGE
ncbi:MAG: uroporphyrinogen-III synthase, partial [Candidatus Dadabacteria bacterium]|nr:uroporphyrinogen-III synthase [Candidatus Dadabacteria bacterium]